MSVSTKGQHEIQNKQEEDSFEKKMTYICYHEYVLGRNLM